LKVMWHIPLPLRQCYHGGRCPMAGLDGKHAGQEANYPI